VLKGPILQVLYFDKKENLFSFTYPLLDSTISSAVPYEFIYFKDIEKLNPIVGNFMLLISQA